MRRTSQLNNRDCHWLTMGSTRSLRQGRARSDLAADDLLDKQLDAAVRDLPVRPADDQDFPSAFREHRLQADSRGDVSRQIHNLEHRSLFGPGRKASLGELHWAVHGEDQFVIQPEALEMAVQSHK
jgi:hypothetical protein